MASLPGHASRVRTLYRRSLKTLLDWATYREVFYFQVPSLREAFESNRHLDDPKEIGRLVIKGEALLGHYAHPEAYKVPGEFGGGKYGRNPEPPTDCELHLDFNRHS